MAKSTSRVKRTRDGNASKLDKESIVNLVKAIVKSGVKLTVHVILGILCIQQARLSQSGLLPTCVSTAPYTDKDIEMDQIHMDFLTTSDKGVDKSIKATFPVKDNLALFQDSTLLKTIRNWTISAQSNNLTYYFGSCMQAAAISYYSMHSNLYGFVNSWLPQWFIMYMSFTIIPLILQISGFWAFIVFVFSSLANWGMLLELGTVTKENPTRKSWRPDTGIWTWPSSPFTILVLILVLCALPLTAGAGVGLAILLGLSTLFTRTRLVYSKTHEIESAMSDNIQDATASPVAEVVASAPPIGSDEGMKGGGPPENDTDKKPTPEEKAAAREENCSVSNKTNSKKKEIFSLTNQIGLTFKVYRHIIMIVMTIYMLMDIYSVMGTNYLIAGIFAAICMYYFTDVYKKYKISACDNFTEGLIGYTNSFRKCELEPGAPHVDEEVERSGFHIPTPDLAKIASAATGAGALTSIASSISLPSVPDLSDNVTELPTSSSADAPTTTSDSSSDPKT